MNYSVELGENFKKEAKKLSKKYISLKQDLQKLSETIAKNPKIGTPLGNDVFKIRLAITSKGKGKSGGARIITLAKIENEKVIFLTIYNKSEKDNITDKELKMLLKPYL